MDQIGARLREARMRGKIDINQVESDTKIRAKYLRAMENEEWGLLPGEIYAKTFLRTYADYLGLDSREVLDDYRRQYERPTDHDLRPLTSGRERDRRPSGGRGGGRRQQPQQRGGGGGFRVPPWALVLIVLVVVVAALWFVGTLGGGHNASNTSSTTTTQTKHHQQHKHKHGTAAHHPAAPKSVHLSLVPTGTVYVCLANGHGRKLINGQQYSAGQKIPVQIARTLLLTLGTSSVTITANGVKVPVAPSSNPIGIRFTPGKHTALASGSQPQC